ncbi:MAG: serine hydrolase domain-containing protein [Granulosicoccus sp.]
MLSAKLDSLVSQYSLNDLAIAINLNDSEILSAGYGYCDSACSQPITAETLFGVASITKLITAIAILQLQDNGLLSLEDSVRYYYPTLKAASNPNLKLQHLLSHSSGWPGMASRFHAINLCAPDDSSGGIAQGDPKEQRKAAKLLSTDDLVAFMNSQSIIPLTEPGQFTSYSNEGFCLLGGIIEQIKGCRWELTIKQEIFKPLLMVNSAIGVPDAIHFKSIAQPITLKDFQRVSCGFWDAPLFYPAGGAVSSVHDLLRLLTVLFHDGPLLTPDSRAQLLALHQPVLSRGERHFGYGLGLEYRQFNSGTVMHWHTGQRAGLSALVAAVPDKGLSMALLSNGSDAPLTALAHQLIALLLKGCDSHWPPTIEQPAVQGTGLNPSGHYGSDEGFSFQVILRDDRVYLRDGGETTEQEMHFLTATSGYIGQQTFSFLITENIDPFDSKPWALALDLRVLRRK